MGYDVFISYSTRDQSQANAVHRALGAEKIESFIATEELQGGSGWAGALVDAIRGSKAVLLLFSRHSNDSPQVLREVQAAVKYRVPIIPVRIDASQPTRDMEYFLGTTHWHDASEPPFENQIGEIIARTRSVIAGERSLLRLAQRTATTHPAWIAAGVAIVVIGLAWWMRSSTSAIDLGALQDPLGELRGAWKLTAGPQRSDGDCYVIIENYTWRSAGRCPPLWRGGGMFQGGQGAAAGVAASGADPGDGWFSAQASGQSLIGVWERGSFGGLTLREYSGNEWRFESADLDEVPDPSTEILARNGHDWPIPDLQGMAARARAVAQRDWQPDAQLVGLTLRGGSMSFGEIGTSAGNVSVIFDFVSPAARLRVQLSPHARFGVFALERRLDPRDVPKALPDRFVELTDVLRAAEAGGSETNNLEWIELRNWSRTSVGSLRLEGPVWLIRPKDASQYAASATAG